MTSDGTIRPQADTQASYDELLDALPMPSVVLSAAGFVIAANPAFVDRLHVGLPEVVGEPLLGWIGRASERGAFGRAFLALRGRAPGHTFTTSLTLVPAIGSPLTCLARACKLISGNILITCELDVAIETSPESAMGRAVIRSLEALDQGMLLLDPSGQIVHANPAASELLGARLVGRSLLELVGPSEVDRVAEALAIAEAGNWHGELELRPPGGEPLPIELSLAAGRGQGQPLVALIRDLQERRQREFEERLIAQLDRILLGSPRPQESIPTASRVLLDALDLERAVLVVHRAGIWERWEIARDEEHRRAITSEPPRTWQGGHQVEPVDADAPAIAAVFGPIERGRSALRVALAAPSGLIGHLLLVAARPQAFDRRTRSLLGLVAPQLALGLANGLLMVETEAFAAYQAMLLDQTSVLLNSLDADGRVVTWNRASERLLGIAAADARGRRFGIDVAVVEPGRWRGLWEDLLRDGMVVREIAIADAQGTSIPLHLEARLLRDSAEITGAVLVGLDLRRRRALEDQVLRSQKLAAVGLLAAGIAHEINNPLSGVVGYSRLLLDKPLEPWVRERVMKIAESGERCRKIVEGVLLFSRQQEGGKRRRLDLGALIDRVIGIGEYQWRMHNVRIVRSYPTAPVMVEADTDQLEQVLLNLLSNAVDAMPRGGTVTIAINAEGEGGARLAVSDQGHGIPAEIQARIFDPFFSTKEIGKGTGLGLAISYGIIKEHGGDILVESAPGQGTTFTVLLPGPSLAPAPPAPDSASPPTTPPATQESR
ncbi:MAG: PAS domain-containing protein [Myxococcales bacterium]|nr:PAS domain-containing protein [Myxococcales bacterium]